MGTPRDPESWNTFPQIMIAVRVGLLRHFPVTEPFPTGWKTAAELHAWLGRYDLAETLPAKFDLGGIDWQACLSSDSNRASITARTVFHGEIAPTELLREGAFAPFRTGNLRLPVTVWKWVLRLAWITGHCSQRACRDDFRRRVVAVADQLCTADRDTLVVSHAGMLAYLSRELRRRGFAGPKLGVARHAQAYVYVRR
jgi:broad specificity phosphatase PhoE